MRRLHRFTGGLALALPVVAVVAALPPAKAAEDHGEGIRKWFESYDAAFNAKDISRLAAFYHPDVTIFEGGGVKAQDGSWKIRHSHTSSRRRPAAQASPAPRW